MGHRAITHQCSLYADDVVLFITPMVRDLMEISAILNLFDNASGLKTNLQKSIIVLIWCTEETLLEVHSLLSCPIAVFPITYLRIPLSTGRLKKEDIEPG